MKKKPMLMFLPLPYVEEHGLHTSRPTSCTARRLLATAVALHLLTTCYTLPPRQQSHLFPKDISFRDRCSRRTNLDVRLMSSLRSQSKYARSPAFGHHARNSSLISLRTALDIVPPIEQRLALQVSRIKRRRGQRGQKREIQQCLRRGQLSTDTSESELTKIPDTRSRLSAHQGSGYDRVKASMPALKSFIRTSSRYRTCRKTRHVPEPPHAESQTRLDEPEVVSFDEWRRKGSASSGHHDFGHDPSARRSVRSFLRYESHSVFIQPVKDYVLRRWKEWFSPSLHNNYSANKADHSDARRTKKKVRLGRAHNIGEAPTVNGYDLCCGSSCQSPRTGPLAHYFVSTRAPCTDSPRSTDNASPAQSISPSRLFDCFNDEQSYFSPLPAICGTSYFARPRRSSTLATTVYSPPIIAQASPNSEGTRRTHQSGCSAASALLDDHEQLSFL